MEPDREPGLGDTLSVFSVLDSHREEVLVFPPSKFFLELCAHNPNAQISDTKWDAKDLINCTEVQKPTMENIGLHFFQKIRKTAGLDYSAPPRAHLSPEPRPKYQRTTVCFSFDVGAVAEVQRRSLHPRARKLYPEHRASFQKVVDGIVHLDIRIDPKRSVVAGRPDLFYGTCN